MNKRISLDLETRSLAALDKVGSYKYAEDPSTEVLILAVREGVHSEGRPVLTWDMRNPARNEATELLHQAIRDGWEIHAFNYSFEWPHLKYVLPRQLGTPIPRIEQMRCTQAVCRTAGLPGSLDACAQFLKLPIQKDKMGSALIQKFSKPIKGGRVFLNWDDPVEFTAGGVRMTAAEAFQRFVDYCARDVETEMAISEVMKPFELKGFPLDWFLLDARMNDRGIPVDTQALEQAQVVLKAHEKWLSEEFRRITGGLSPKQNKAVLEWLENRGYRGDNLRKDTREKFQDDPRLMPEAREALRIASDLSFAAVKKVPAMLTRAMSDGKVRGTFKWCGAQKTWRWSSEGIQLQNMKKPPKWLRKVIEQAYNDLRSGQGGLYLELTYCSPYELIACLARYFIRYDDQNLLDLDFASVEARVLPALIECQRILDRFVSGEGDIYTQTGESLAKVLKEKFKVDFDIDRDTGKVVVLATQFQGGWHAVFTATGSTWKREWCEAAARIVRQENPEFKEAWKKFQDVFVEAMDSPDRWHPVTKYVSMGYTKKGPFPRMLMRLASGRSICWPHPEKHPITMVGIEKSGASTRWTRIPGHYDTEDLPPRSVKLAQGEFVSRTFRTWEVDFHGHVKGKTYGRVKTYGGDMLQSATQGTAADLLAYGALEAERQGFEPILVVHDQCLAPATGDPEDFRKALTTVPPWFEGFPLDAEADVVRSYCKA